MPEAHAQTGRAEVCRASGKISGRKCAGAGRASASAQARPGGGAGCEENLSDLQSLPHLLPVAMAAYKLVLIRHGESAWNLENRFSGWYDADLSPAGHEEAKRGGQALRGMSWTSAGWRAGPAPAWGPHERASAHPLERRAPPAASAVLIWGGERGVGSPLVKVTPLSVRGCARKRAQTPLGEIYPSCPSGPTCGGRDPLAYHESLGRLVEGSP